MLQIFRDKAQSTFIQAIVLVIALVFVFWGVGSNMMGKREAAIVVNDEEISFQDYQQVYDQLLSNYREQFGGSVPEELLQTLGLTQQVKNQLIQSSLLRQGATEMGLLASSPEVQRRIQDMVQFQENNSFNMDKYNSLLSSNRTTPHKFEASMRYDMLSGKGVTAIGNFSTIVTETEIFDRFQQDKESISLLFAKLSPLDFHDQVSINEAEMLTWFEQNKDTYKTAPQIKLKFLFFPYAAAAESPAVSEEQIEKRYQANLSRYQEAEKRHARHILFAADDNSSTEMHASQAAKAEDILERARGGEDFAILAQTFSEGPTKDSGGNLGFFGKGEMVQPFDDTVFSMSTGDISDVVKTRFGYHIIFLEEIQPAATTPLDEVRAQINKEIANELIRPTVFKMANGAYEGIIAAGSLQEYAKRTPEASILETDFFPRSASPGNLDKSPNILNTAFSLKNGELSSLLESPAGYSILYAEAIQEPDFPELENVREKVTADYTVALAKALAHDKAAEVLAALKSGTTFAEAAQAAAVAVKDATLLRTSTGQEANGFPPSLIGDAFALTNEAALPEEVAKVGDDLFLYQFTARKLPPLDTLSDKEKEQYRTEILSSKQEQLLISWIRHQEKNATIFSNKNL